MAKPNTNEYAPFYQRYIDLVEEDDIRKAFARYSNDLKQLIYSINDKNQQFAYADGKWTAKQVLQHIIDTERVFGYRAMCIARGETQSLPGFDENQYAEKGHANHRILEEMQEEFWLLRRTNVLMFRSFSDEELSRTGTASGHSVSVRAIGYMIIGHLLHHRQILKERYDIG